MSLPLYNHAFHEENSLVKTPGKGNTGLWYNKFFWGWQKGKWQLKDEAKLDWIKKVVWVEDYSGKEVPRKIGDSNLLADSVNRITRLVKALGGKTRIYSTSWHLATGLGLSHPVENGMTWHHTLGVPYLPGSAVKGIIRTWAEQWVDPSPKSEDINRIFGPWDEDKSNAIEAAKTVGTVIFFDALPVQPVELASDIMTPHYQKYYGGADEPPGDWCNPNPIPFLTVGAGQLFLFAIAPRKKKNTADLDLVLQWLDEALEMIGAGAKTATGYGRFARWPEQEKNYFSIESNVEPAATKEKVEQVSLIPKELAGPLAEEMDKDGYSDNPDKFMESVATKWITTMQAEETPLADRQMIARLVKHWYQVNRPDQWQKPNKKNTVKIAVIRNILGE